jgi:hypothetical protein
MRFGDPKDLRECSTTAFILHLQLETLDFARRYYSRQKDTTSRRRSEEIKKTLLKISEIQTAAVLALIPDDVNHMASELIYKKALKDNLSKN